MANEKQLEGRVKALESRVSKLEKAMSGGEVSNVAAMYDASAQSKVVAKSGGNVVGEDGAFSRFIDWIKDDFLMKVGAFLLILALAWFVTYAFAENWIGPVGRISLGSLAGLAMLAFGYKIIPSKPIPGQVLTATGSTMIMITLSAARYVYDFFTPATALGLISLVVILTAAVSVTKRTMALAILALLGGAVAPFLVDSPEPNYVALLSYIFVLDVGVFLVAFARGWRVLIALGLIITAVYASVFSSMQWNDDYSLTTIWIFMALFFGLFFFTNLVALLRTQKVVRTDLFTNAFNGLLVLVWIFHYVPEEWRSIVLILVTLCTVGAVYMLLKNKRIPPASMYVFAALSIASFFAATAFELDGFALTIAYSLEAFAVIALAHYVIKDQRALSVVSLLPIVPIFLAFQNGRFSSYSWEQMALFNENFFVLVVLILSLAGSAFVLKQSADQNKNANGHMEFGMIHAGVAGVFGLMLVWLSLHNLLESSSVARGIALVTYVLVGVRLFFHGAAHDLKRYRVVGGILIAGVVLRLLLVEVWAMPLSGRVVTFVLVGALLVATAFFQKKHIKK